MKIDLFKLNNFNKVDIDSDIEFPQELYENMNIRGIKDAYVKGILKINFEDELLADLEVSGVFILPCAVTLENVDYSFTAKIDENLGNFADFYNKNKNSLDILPVLWENVVLEVPIRVVKEGVSLSNTSGDGWELVSDD